MSSMPTATPFPSDPRLRRLMPLLAVVVAVIGGALGDLARHELIEPVARAAACADGAAPWWCLARTTIRIAAQNFVIAGLALIGALASLLYRGPEMILGLGAAMFLGAAGMFLYSATVASMALAIAFVRAAGLDRA